MSVQNLLKTNSTNPSSALPIAGAYNTSAPAPIDGQSVPLQTDSAGNLLVNVATGGGANASVGATGALAPTSATEIGVVDPNGLLQAASNTTPVPVSGAMTTNTALATWNSSTALNTAAAVFSNVLGQNTVNIVVIMGTTITGGTMIIEASADGSHWQTIPAFNPLSQTIYNSQFTFVQNTNNYFIVDVTGWTYVRVRLNNVITGSGTVTLQTVTDAFPQSANVQVNGSVTIGNIPGAGTPGTSVPGSALYEGARAATAYPTAVTDGQIVGVMSDKAGRLVAVSNVPRDLVGTAVVSNNSTASGVSFIAAGATGVFNDIITFIATNRSATATVVTLTDGTISYTFAIAANGGIVINLPTPIPASSSATAWTIGNSATVACDYIAVYAKNK